MIFSPLFEKYRNKSVKARYVDFNQGLDARLLTPEKMKRLAEIPIQPLRIAFDSWSLKDTYEKAVRLAAANGIRSMSNYLLYNYKEKPIDLYLRLKLNIDLCEELDVNIYSFPMKYHPIQDQNILEIEHILEDIGIENLYVQSRQFLILLKEKLVEEKHSLKKHLVMMRMNMKRYYICQKL